MTLDQSAPTVREVRAALEGMPPDTPVVDPFGNWVGITVATYLAESLNYADEDLRLYKLASDNTLPRLEQRDGQTVCVA